MNRRLKFNLMGLFLGIILWVVLFVFVKLMECGGAECKNFPESYFFTFLFPLALIVGIIILNLIAIEQSSKRIFNIKLFPLIIFCSYILTKIVMFLYELSYSLFMNLSGIMTDNVIEFFKSVDIFLFLSGFIIFISWFSKKRVLSIKTIFMATCQGLTVGFSIIFMLTILLGKFLDPIWQIGFYVRYLFDLYPPPLISVPLMRVSSVIGGLITLIIWLILRKKASGTKNE